MSIQDELNQIKSAVYGADVRDAIHDGVEKGYNKASQAESNSLDIKQTYDEILMNWNSDPNKDPEVIAARGGLPQLEDRLDATDAQLAQAETDRFYKSLNKHKHRKPMITIIDDDTRSAVWDELKPLVEQYNIPMTLSTITGHVDVNSNSLTLAQLKELESIGFEIVSHTQNHTRLADVSLSQAETELYESRKWLDDNGFNGRKTLVYPFGSQNEDVRRVVRRHYESAFDIDGGLGGALTPPLDTYRMKRVAFNLESGVNQVQHVKDNIDEAFETNGYVVLMTHCFYNGFSQSDLGEVIQYAIAKGLEFVTVSDGMSQFGNLVDIDNEYGQFIIDADGKGVGHQEMSSTRTQNFTIDTPLADYPTKNSSMIMYQGHPGVSGFPESGIVETYKRSDTYNYQKLLGYNSRKTYIRYWESGSWSDFKEENESQYQSGTVTLESDWTGTLTYSRDKNGQVWLRGQVTAGTVTKLTTIGTLPLGYSAGQFYPSFGGFNDATTDIAKDAFYISARNIRLIDPTGISTGDTVRISFIYQTTEV